MERVKTRIKPPLIGILGHIFAVQRHYVSYADLLKIRYSPFDCLIMVGTEDRLVRETNSYIIQRVCFCFERYAFSFIRSCRHLVVDLLNSNMQDMAYRVNVLKKLMKNYLVKTREFRVNKILFFLFI